MTQDTLSYTTVATTSPFLLSLLTTPGSAALRIKNSEPPSAIQVDEAANHEVARRLGVGVQVYDCDPATGTFTFREPVRNRYFYGQLLGVRNFELETEYFIRQRSMLSRLILGYGVVCGLNVELTSDGRKVVIWPGVALDKWGRDIVVAQKTAPIPVPPAIIQSALDRARGGGHDQACVQVLIWRPGPAPLTNSNACSLVALGLALHWP